MILRALAPLALVVTLVGAACAPDKPAVVHRVVAPPPAATWALDTHRYRIELAIDTGAVSRVDRPAVTEIDFGNLLAGAGALGRFDPRSLRVVEVGSDDEVVADAVPFQYDRSELDLESGELVVLLTGRTPADTTRRYHVYFDIEGSDIAPPVVSSRIRTREHVLDENNPSIRVDTDIGTWFIRESSGGASSLVDETGADWLAYSLAPEAQGQFRGMPNAVRGYGYFHPDFYRSPVDAVRAGPLRTLIDAESRSTLWRVRWKIYDRFATVTMTKSAWAYYLMWEGLPGGDIDPTTDLVMRATGVVTRLNEAWTGDLPGDEWVAFIDPEKGRSAFVAHPESDDVVDSYRLMDSGMTVLGFGREGVTGHLVDQHTMVVGLSDATTHEEIGRLVRDAIREPTVRVGEIQRAPD